MKAFTTLLAVALGGALIAAVPKLEDAPDGVTINVSPDGSYQVISVASGVYDFSDPDDIRDARQAATLRAKAQISKFLKEEIASAEKLDEASRKVKFQTSNADGQTASTFKLTAKRTLESVRNSSSALLKGVIVLQEGKFPASGSAGGEVRVMVGTSPKTIAVASVAEAGATAVAPAPAPAPTAPAPATPSQASPVVSQAGGLPPLPEGWIVCVGVGADRHTAVVQALIEGISQTYGQAIQNNERLSERMKKLKQSVSVAGNVSTTVQQETSHEQEGQTLTQTAGFVREYRVVQVAPQGANVEATVYALLDNPRQGGAVALMVCRPEMRLEDKAAIYALGPNRRLSGAEVARAVQFALPKGLADTGRFLILTDQSINAVVENKTVTDAMTSANLSGSQELMRIGQGLTPDYSLRSEITDVKYSKTLGQDKRTGKFGSVYKMTLRLNATLLNDRTGQAVKSESLTLTLDNDEIKTILAHDEDADLLQALLSKLADPLYAWIMPAR